MPFGIELMSSQKSAMRRKTDHAAGAPAATSRPVPSSGLGVALNAADLGYSQVVHDSWRACFRGLPAATRFLDIAPGIGSVALVAQEVSAARDCDFEIHGLDLASTFSAEPLTLNGIRFHARRYGSSTPFEDGYFDFISMQWAPPDDGVAAAGIDELRRILKRGGSLRLMFHALGGAAHRQCLGRVQAVDTLLDEVGLLEHARHMFEVAFTQETALRRDLLHSVMLALESQQAYTDATRRVVERMQGTPNPKAVEHILQVIADCWDRRQSMTLAAIRANLDSLEGDMRAAQARLRAACAVAVDETRAHRIGRLFKDAGFQKVKVKPFKAPDDSLIGWDLQAV
jgi:ubiquinone/menaquinone biosynthesis C-methylase UbiE